MANGEVIPMPDRSTARGRVAASVRGKLAEAKITTNRLPQLLGKSQSYWSRRVNGDIAFDVDDLGQIGDLLGISFLVVDGGDQPLPPRPVSSSASARSSMDRAFDYGSRVIGFPARRALDFAA